MQSEIFNTDLFKCRHCGEGSIDQLLIARLELLVELSEVHIIITSGYRCPDHPMEAKKYVKGAHTKGLACDFQCSPEDEYKLLKTVLLIPFTGIGLHLKDTPKGRFFHVDIVDRSGRRVVWTY